MALIRRFWWGKGCEDSSICWKSWNDLCSPKSSGGMGFNDLKSKNLALLAKQGWRLLKQPDSLLAQVFKARYYPQTSFMNAALGNRPSYIWRSIVEGRKLLEIGVRYQVGNGQNIHIWEDKWIPLPYGFKLNPINKAKYPNATVAELMIPETNTWNLPLLQYLFCSHEVDLIAKIPLCVNETIDQLVWHHSSNGQFSVKSGYKAYQQFHKCANGSSSMANSAPQKSVWNMIWNWPIQPKIRHFIWRAMHNILPTGVNLARRHILGVRCPHCNSFEETDKHILFDCQYARKIWNHMGLTYLWLQSPVTSFVSLATRLMMEESPDTASLFFITSWLIWKARCTMKFERKLTSQSHVISTAFVLLHEFGNVMKLSPTLQDNDRWTKPTPGFASIHVDAGVAPDGKASYGVIVRNSDSNILSAESGPLQRHLSVEHAELLALLRGLRLAREIGLLKVHIFTDSKLAYNRIASKEKDLSLFSPLVQTFQQLLCEFQYVECGFVRREGNVLSHLLAKLGLSMCNPMNWGSKPPYDVVLAVLNDSVNFNE